MAVAMVAVSLDLLAWAQEGDAVVVAPSEEAEPWSADLEVPVRITTWLVWLTAAGLWAAWFARALGAAAHLLAPRIAPAVAVALLFAPVANWIWPKRALDDAWRAAGSRPSVALNAWWLLTCLFAASVIVALALVPADPEAWPSEYIPSYRADVVSYGLGAVCALSAIPFTWRLTSLLGQATPSADAPARPTALHAADLADRRRPAAVRACRAAAWVAAALASSYAVLSVLVAATDPAASTLQVAEAVVGTIGLLALLPVACIWLAWLHAATRAAHRSRPAWDVVAWFVPVVNLVLPWRTLRTLLGPAVAAPTAARALCAAHVTFIAAFLVSLPATVATIPDGPDLATWRWYGWAEAAFWALIATSSCLIGRVTQAVRRPATRGA